MSKFYIFVIEYLLPIMHELWMYFLVIMSIICYVKNRDLKTERKGVRVIKLLATIFLFLIELIPMLVLQGSLIACLSDGNSTPIESSVFYFERLLKLFATRPIWGVGGFVLIFFVCLMAQTGMIMMLLNSMNHCHPKVMVPVCGSGVAEADAPASQENSVAEEEVVLPEVAGQCVEETSVGIVEETVLENYSDTLSFSDDDFILDE